jgi:hypothetical protein
MFHFAFFVESDPEYRLLLDVLNFFIHKNCQYSRLVIYFGDKEGPNPLLLEFKETMIYAINQAKIDLHTYSSSKSQGELIKEACDQYGGLLTFVIMRNLINKQGESILPLDLIIHRMVESVQSALTHQYSFKGCLIISDLVNAVTSGKLPAPVSPVILSKSYYEQYRDHLLTPADPYFVPQIISFHFQQVWVKKMIFELGYLSSYREIVTTPADLDFLLNILYYKYKVMYAKDM